MSVNKVILVGNVGKDPDVRYIDNNVCVASFTLATTDRGYKTAAGVQIPDKTEWHNIVLWRGLGEIAEKYVRKGSQVYIEGKLRTRSWDDQNGIRRYTTEIYADNMMLLGRKNEAQNATVTAPLSSTETGGASPYQVAPNEGADDLPF